MESPGAWSSASAVRPAPASLADRHGRRVQHHVGRLGDARQAGAFLGDAFRQAAAAGQRVARAGFGIAAQQHRILGIQEQEVDGQVVAGTEARHRIQE